MTDVDTTLSNKEVEKTKITENIERNDYQARRYILTINNPTETDEEMREYVKMLEHIKYAAFQREKGHETGTEHFQMFLIFSISKRFQTIKNLFPKAHIEKCNGSNTQCRDYCTKSDTRIGEPIEIGTFVEKGGKQDESEFLELVESGADDFVIMRLFPKLYLKHMNDLSTLRNKFLKEKNGDIERDIKTIYIWGDTGVGKSYAVHQKWKQKDLYVLSDYHRDPWYSYTGQQTILMEEYRSDFRLKEMLQYLDRYSLELPARYNNKVACYDKVFIVSNIPLIEQYKYTADDYESKKAFYRRVHNVLHFTKDKIIVEKCRDKTLSELRELLPDYLSDKLELGFSISTFEEIPCNNLPFDNNKQEKLIF